MSKKMKTLIVIIIIAFIGLNVVIIAQMLHKNKDYTKDLRTDEEKEVVKDTLTAITDDDLKKEIKDHVDVDKFYKDLGSLFFKEHEMSSKRRASGIFHELFLDEKSCGYALSLNSADQIKKYSHLFSDIMRMIFDEFQSETNHYCVDEVKKLLSVHTSVARGQGEQVLY